MHSATHKLPADERRAVTVETVVELAAEQNPGDITTTAIAERMQLTQGALFRHFPGKDAIWEAVANWVADRLLGRVDAAMAQAATPLAAIEAAFRAHVGFVTEHPGAPRIIFAELQRAGDSATKRLVRSLMGRYATRVKRQIEAGKTHGEIAAEIDAEAAAMLYIGTIQGLVMQSMLSGSVKRLGTDAPGAFALYARALRSKP